MGRLPKWDEEGLSEWEISVRKSLRWITGGVWVLVGSLAVAGLLYVLLAADSALGHIVHPHTPVHHFDDITISHQFGGDVGIVANQFPKHWMNGTGYRTFNPDATITTSQMVKVIERAFPGGMSRQQFAAFMVGGAERAMGWDLDGRPNACPRPDLAEWAWEQLANG